MIGGGGYQRRCERNVVGLGLHRPSHISIVVQYLVDEAGDSTAIACLSPSLPFPSCLGLELWHLEVATPWSELELGETLTHKGLPRLTINLVSIAAHRRRAGRDRDETP